jgi:predicted amidophosphoribosyltransferase
MPESPLLASKKCPFCHQWSTWQQRPDDRCEHCGNLLDPQAKKSATARDELANQKMPSVILMEINPEDGPLKRFFKTIVRGGQLAFAAIMTFIMWVVAAVAG